MKKWLLALFCFLSLLSTATAQVTLTASVDKTALALDDELTLTIEVQGASGNMIMPQMPSLPAFNVYSREVEQSTVNGHTTTSFRYIMLPRFAGKASIGEISFSYQGKTYKTDPISVTIYRNAQGVPPNRASTQTAYKKTNGNIDTRLSKTMEKPDPNLPPLEYALASQAYAQAGNPFFMVAAVSNPSPYVNEPTLLAVRFYYSRSFYDAPYQKPEATDIFMEALAPAQGTQTIGGTLYRYEEQRYQLMPASPGKAVIGPASIRYQTGNSPFSAFDRLFGGTAVSEEKTATTTPITLTVRPLPAQGKPKSFYGAVGEGFSLSAKAEPTLVEAGEAVNLTLLVKGPANLKTTQDVIFPQMEGFKLYPAAAESGSLPSIDGNSRGYKTFKAVLVPSASGVYTIPSIKWSYFSPVTRTYKTLQTDPIQLQVVPSSKAENGFDFNQAASSTGFQSLGKDVAYLKTSYAPATNGLERVSEWDKLNYIFLSLLGFCILFASFGRKSLAAKRAYADCRNRLKKADSVGEVADAVADYLQNKFKISTGSLPLKNITQALRKKGVTPATAESFSLLWQRLDAARFAPGEWEIQSTQELSVQATDVLHLIEEETK